MVFQPDPPPAFQAAAAAEAGPLWNQWFRRKISLALTLSAAIPVLLLGYSIFGALMAWLGQDPFFGHDALWGQTLLVFTGLLMSAGGLVIWDLASIVRRTAETVAATRDVESAVAEKAGQIGGPHGLCPTHPLPHRAEDGRDQPVPPASRRGLPRPRGAHPPPQGSLLQGRGAPPLQPPLLLDPSRRGSSTLPALPPP